MIIETLKKGDVIAEDGYEHEPFQVVKDAEHVDKPYRVGWEVQLQSLVDGHDDYFFTSDAAPCYGPDIVILKRAKIDL